MTLDPLLLDLSPWCPQPPSCWPTLAAAGPPWSGAILRAGHGLHDDGAWVRDHGRAVRAAGLELGLYWYLTLGDDAEAQADAFCALLGELQPTLIPIIDVEGGSGNAELVAARGLVAGRALIQQHVRAFVARIRERTGQPCVLYAGGWLRGVLGRAAAGLGCELLWISAYTARLWPWLFEGMGFTLDRVWAWQYAGLDGHGVHDELAGYPRTTPIGPADINAVIGGMQRARWRVEMPSVCGPSGPMVL